ncbi:MAG: hypothetical protein ACK4TL_16030 [Hyphomicrobiaceae bacterium]
MKPDLNAATARCRPAEQAAQAIVALINSRPYSPRQEEIEEIIARLVVGPANAVPATGLDLDEYGPDLTTFRSSKRA